MAKTLGCLPSLAFVLLASSAHVSVLDDKKDTAISRTSDRLHKSDLKASISQDIGHFAAWFCQDEMYSSLQNGKMFIIALQGEKNFCIIQNMNVSYTCISRNINEHKPFPDLASKKRKFLKLVFLFLVIVANLKVKSITFDTFKAKVMLRAMNNRKSVAKHILFLTPTFFPWQYQHPLLFNQMKSK